MIELGDKNVRSSLRQSSKGNQLKWEHEGIWYKADYTGYEGLAEYMVSNLLRYSNLENEPYYPEEIKIRVRDILLQQRRSYQYLFR